jgi:sugar O-acyltransferase (sialic acid O-acetyltransferase NeuD family)
MKKENILLVGGGGHCKSVIDVLENQNLYKIVGIVDLPEKAGTEVLGYKVIGNDDDLPELIRKYKNAHISLGQIRNAEPRQRIYKLLKELGANMPVIISPQAYVSCHAVVAEGSIIMHQAIVNAGAKVGANCIINTRALIEHDAEIGDHCHVSTGATVNGGVIIGQGSFIGSGAVTKEYINIPDNSFIKANSIVK